MQIIKGNFIFDGIIDNVNTIGFSQVEDGDGPYLLVQWRDVYDEQDVQLGQDQPYIEVCGQEFSQYGGVESVNLTLSGILIKFDEDSRIGKAIGDLKIDLDHNDGATTASQKLIQILS